MDDEHDEPLPGPLLDFARAINPDGGALGLDVPFTLTGETSDTSERQPALFTSEEPEP